jgi:hypothetical protein
LLKSLTLQAVARPEARLLSPFPPTGFSEHLICTRLNSGEPQMKILSPAASRQLGGRCDVPRCAGWSMSKKREETGKHYQNGVWAYNPWLGETDDGNLKELLLPHPADQMGCQQDACRNLL